MNAPTAGARRLDDDGGPAALARLLSVLADPTRLRILALLDEGDRCVCEIHQSLRLPQPTVSRHLAQLRRAGLVAARKDGLWVHYRRASNEAHDLQALLDAVRACTAVSSEGRDDRATLDALSPCCDHPRWCIP